MESNKHRGARLDEYHVLASDISQEVLAKAKSGRYTDFELKRGMPHATREKYFTRDGTEWRISQHIQKLVEFRRLNLVEPPPWMEKCDVIFCRNVLIYFDDAIKTVICRQLHQLLNKGGILILGASENLLFLKGTGVQFESVREGDTLYYVKTAPVGRS